jgi:Leucine-rich repeat (LRR) protein
VNTLVTIIEQIAPMRLWKSLMRNPCCCNSDASKQLSLLDHKLDPAYFTNNNSNPLTTSELNSLGFDRSWTITKLRLSGLGRKNCMEIRNSLVKNDSHHMLTVLDIDLHDDRNQSVDEILCVGWDAFCNVEKLSVGVRFTSTYTFTLYDIETFEIFAKLRTLRFSHIRFDFEYSQFSVLSKLEELNLSHCTNIDDFAHIAQLTKLRNLSFDQNGTMMNTSSVSLLTNLSSLHMGISSDEVLDLNLSHLAGLTKLRNINMQDSRVEGNIESLSQLKNLTALSFDVGVTSGDISVLMNFPDMQRLSLYGYNNHVDALSPLRGNIHVFTHLIKLKDLDLLGFNIQGDIAALSQCCGLERLRLSALPQLQGDISVLSTLTKLNSCTLEELPSINGDISVFSNISFAFIQDCVGLTGNKSALIDARSQALLTNRYFSMFGCPNVSDEEEEEEEE